ncbi:traB domain-containing protein [Diorhabda carinulata]|uniref:traB domain-containing protein n=1 Tax=Diorhabda carinulata TaxID=1163345 RepID=UPI0025A1C3BC|nr:traB domain-containing protein [Diorhabda carinulata]
MDNSLTNFELTESTVKIDPDTENGSGSDKSDPLEIVSLGDAESSSSKSDDDFDNNLPKTVTLLRHEKTGAKVYLIGTAHFSKESQEDVRKVITTVLPHVVVLELCSSRTNILALDEETILQEAKNIDMQKILSTIRSNGLYNGLIYLLVLNMSAYLTKEIGMAPGGEFRVAFKEASNIPNCTIHLGDRSMSITLQRALARLSWFQTVKLAWHLLTSKEPITVEDIEKCKEKDMLEQVLSDFSEQYPAFKEVFLDERDIYLTNSLQQAVQSRSKSSQEGDFEHEPIRVVGVVGMGHTPGIIKLWPTSQEHNVNSIVTIPPPSLTSKIIKRAYKITLLAFGGYLVYKFVPVPKFLKENTHIVAQKILIGLRAENNFRLSLN